MLCVCTMECALNVKFHLLCAAYINKERVYMHTRRPDNVWQAVGKNWVQYIFGQISNFTHFSDWNVHKQGFEKIK